MGSLEFLQAVARSKTLPFCIWWEAMLILYGKH